MQTNNFIQSLNSNNFVQLDQNYLSKKTNSNFLNHNHLSLLGLDHSSI